MADRLYYKITLKRPNGELEKYRFPHVWDGEAARVEPYSISDIPPAPVLATFASGSTMTATGTLAASLGDGVFPLTAATLATELGDAGATATEIWNCQEPTGNLVGEIVGEELVSSGSPIQGDTSGWSGQNSVAISDASTQRFAGTDATLISGVDASKAFLVVFNVPAQVAATSLIAHKRGAVLADGFDFGIGTDGRLLVEGGSTTAWSNNPIVYGEWHAAIAIHNRTTGKLEILNSKGSIGSVAKVYDSTNGGFVTIGDNPNVLNAAGVSVAYVAAFEGAAAELLTQATLDAFWSLHTLYAESDTFPSANSTDEWEINTQLSAPFVNTDGGGRETLANTGGTIAGASPKSTWTADSTAANSDRLVASGPVAGNSNNQDVAYRLIFRANSPFVGNDYLLTKYAGSIGLFCITAASGTLTANFRSGSTYPISASGARHDDGFWHVLSLLYDQSTQMLYMKTDLCQSVAPVGPCGSLGNMDNAGVLCVNSLNDATGGGAADLEVRYVGTATGATAQAFYDENVEPPLRD